MRSDIQKLAHLIAKRNVIEADIAAIVGRPGEIGHVGEYIASKIFNINLEKSAVQAGWDGCFTEGDLSGKTVNIKWYAKREGILDINTHTHPDYYLVLAGPKANEETSRGKVRPWLIKEVFLFETTWLINELRNRNIKIRTAASVAQAYWEHARIFPGSENSQQVLMLSKKQQEMLKLFG